MSGFTPPLILSNLFACLARLRLAVTEPGILPDHPLRADRLTAFLWFTSLLQRLTSLVARLRSGPLPASRPRPQPAPAHTEGGTLAASPLRMPRGAWLAQAMPVSADLAILRALIAHPDLQPLFAQAPAQFARLLRPLCRAAGCPLPATLTKAEPQPNQAGAPKPPPEPPRHPRLTPPPAHPSLRASLLNTAALETNPLFPTLFPKTA